VLKKYFIPNKKNHHRPHILRKKAVLVILGVVLFFELLFLIHIFFVIPSTGLFSAILPDVLTGLTNKDREDNNLGSLTTNNLLQKAALLKAEDMASKGYFAHTTPDGKNPWFWLDQVGYDYEYAGENLAVNFIDTSDIEKAFMNSDSHRANILGVNFTEIGIAVAKGIYKGKETEFVVQFFGKPAPVKENKLIVSGTQKSIIPTASLVPIPSKIVNKPQEMAVFKKVETGSVAGENNSGSQISNSTSNNSTPWFEKILSMPRSLMFYFYLALSVLMLSALILKIFVKIKIQHPKLIFNGIFVLFIIFSIFYFNSLILGKGFIF
jgi:hypothetical protein